MIPQTAPPEADPATAEAVVVLKRSRTIGLYLALGWVGAMILLAVFAGLLPFKDPLGIDVRAILDPPSAAHWFGTDGIGRDVFARVVHGTRVSLIVGVVSAGVGLFLGTLIGMSAGFFRGRFERLVMASIDVMLAFPNLVLLLAFVAFIGRSFTVVAVTVGLLSIPTYARVARAATLVSNQREFVIAARGLGAPTKRILFREILPNVLPSVLAWALVAMALVIVLEGSLAFLGLGIPPPTPTWGGMIAEGKAVLAQAPYLVLFPSLFMFLTVLAFNYAGDQMRRRLHAREANT